MRAPSAAQASGDTSTSASIATAAPQDLGGGMQMQATPALNLTEGFGVAERSNETLLKGLDRLKAIAKNYREAKTLSDTISIEVASPMGPQKQEMKVAFGPNGSAMFDHDDAQTNAVDGKVSIHDWHATILHLLGLDHEKLTYRHAGRDFRLTDVHGRVVKEIVA